MAASAKLLLRSIAVAIDANDALHMAVTNEDVMPEEMAYLSLLRV
jgi:hypothetical protein